MTNFNELTSRIAHLSTIGIILFTTVYWVFTIQFTFEWLFALSILIILLLLNFLALISHLKESKWIIHLVPLSLIAVLVFWYIAFISYVSPYYGTDSLVMSHVGAEAVLKGENPYEVNLIPYFKQFKLSPRFITPRMDGTIVNTITYPAFNFLVFTPFIVAGLTDLRWALLFFHIATLIAMYIFSPVKLRPIILLPWFMIPVFLVFTPGAATDIVWVFFLTIALVFWHSKTYSFRLKNLNIELNKILSGIFIGFSLSFKQITWFVLPFFLIRLWNDVESNYFQKLKRILSFCIASLLPFVMLNIPFIIDSPSHWVEAVLAPLFPKGAPMAPYGIGFALSVISGMLLPESYFSNLTILVTFISIIAYYLYYDRLGSKMWIFLMIIPLFWWRSLLTYFVYWIPLAIFEIAHGKGRKEKISLTSFLLRNRKRAVFFILIFFTLFSFIYTLNVSKSHEVLSIEFLNITPIQEEDIDSINSLAVTIRNNGFYPIIPRFGIFWHYGIYILDTNLVYWDILDGPETLLPTESATYHISTKEPVWFLRDGDKVSIIVNDAGNPNIISTSKPINIEALGQLGIINGHFRYWDFNTQLGLRIPYRWILLTKGSAEDNFTVSASVWEEKSSLKLQVYQDGEKVDGITFGKKAVEEEWAYVGVTQEVTTPRQISFYVFPTFDSKLDSIESGIRISDGGSHQLLILFSDVPERKYLYQEHPNLQQIVLVLPTKLNQWNYHTVNITEAWTYFGWDLPERLHIELYTAAHYTEPGNYTTYFAEIKSYTSSG